MALFPVLWGWVLLAAVSTGQEPGRDNHLVD